MKGKACRGAFTLRESVGIAAHGRAARRSGREPPPEGGPTTEELSAAAARALAPRIGGGLGFDVRRAIESGVLRLVVLHMIDGGPLPRDWAIPVQCDEVVVACAPLPRPLVGMAAIVVAAPHLPPPDFDDAERDRIATALADALLAELSPFGR
jgi:hypothetical protein